MDTSYTLTFEDRSTYLYVHLEGSDSLESGLLYWQEILDRAHELGRANILVHENMFGKLSKAQIFEIVTHFTKPENLGIRMAFFDENLDDESLNALGQLVATNRAARVEIFPSLEEAIHWIEQQG